ncbi:unnamed protein product [Trichobilharzia szidati]|nr:unnamed protein product [Trichobilharzia szidati]
MNTMNINEMYPIRNLFLVILFLFICSVNIHLGCMKSSMFYRTPIRTRSHVFAPGEYQPKQAENNPEASGPLDTRDFHYQLPSKRLVRVDSPYILFDSEEARWMTKGCRDRLIKLSTQIQNTWAKQEVILRVIRSWVKPPPNYKPLPTEDNSEEHIDDTGDSPLLYEKNFKSEKNARGRDSVFAEQPPTVFSGKKTPPFVPMKSKPHLDAPVIDMTPEMVDDQFIQHHSDPNRIGTQSNGLKFLHYIPPSRSVSPQRNRWHPMQNNPNHLTPSPARQSLSAHSAQNQRSYKPSATNFHNSHKISSSLPDSSYNTMIRLPRSAAFLKKSNFTIANVTLIDNQTDLTNPNPNRLHKIVERSVNTMHAPDISRKHRNYDHNSNNNNYKNNNNNNQNHLLPTSVLNELRMEEFHYAGRAVDIELTTRQFGRPHNSDLHLGVLAQIAYYVAHFDWCFFNRAGHVHCSVKPDSIITSQWFGCFPGESKVHRADGEVIPIKDLQIGDRIITQNSENGLLTNALVFGFLDRDEHGWSPLVEIKFQMDSNLDQYGTIRLTEDHLIYIYDNSIMSNNTENIQVDNKKVVFASSVTIGQIIFVHYENATDGLKKAQVISVQTIQPTINDSVAIRDNIGIYAPITDTGTLIIDNVLVSCFAHISNHNLATLIIWPWKLLYTIMSNVHPYINFIEYTENNERYSDYSIGVPWLIQWIYRLTHLFLPESLFYQDTINLT